MLQYGKEAILDLNSYSLSGGKKGALRRNVAKLDGPPLVRLATSITNTKGAADVGLYMRYKRFFVSLLLFPNRYREYQK